MNFSGYVQVNQQPLEESPLNNVDVLVLCWLAYFDFSSIKDKLPIKIKDIDKFPVFQTLDPYEASFMARKSRIFMKRLMASPRFNEFELVESKELNDTELNVQFRALAVKNKDNIFALFSGTDPTFVGWKEDFYLSFKETIASHQLGLDFVQEVRKLYDLPLIIAGHSKGGNIATYVLSELENIDNIQRVYSYDGPNFRNKELYKGKEERLLKITKIIPQSSFVGILFTNQFDSQIVKSRNILMFQHNPLEWVVTEDDFAYTSKTTMASRYIDRCVNNWIYSLDVKDRERFTQILFDSLSNLPVNDFTTLAKRLLYQVKPAYTIVKNLPKEDKKFFMKIVFKLVKHLMPSSYARKLKKNITVQN